MLFNSLMYSSTVNIFLIECVSMVTKVFKNMTQAYGPFLYFAVHVDFRFGVTKGKLFFRFNSVQG